MKPTINLLLSFLLLTTCTLAQAAVDEEYIFRTITAADGIADNSAQTIKCTKTGRMTITTIGNINFYDGANFSHISTAREKIYKLEDYHGHYHLYYDNNHHLWLKSSSGVSCVDLITERYISNIDSIFGLYGVKGRVDDMFIDINGDIWLCQNGYVITSKYRWKKKLLEGENLQDLEVFDQKQLMLFYGNGQFVCYDVKTGHKLYQNSVYSAEDSKKYYRTGVQLINGRFIYMIRNGETGAALLCLDTDSHQWKVVMRSDYHLNNMVVHDGKLYIASEWGYLTYDLLTSEIKHHKELTLRNGHKLATDINAIEFDLQGGIWLGTEQRGLLYGPPLHAPFQLYGWDMPIAGEYATMMDHLKGITEFRGKKANVMMVDSRHWTWVGTPNGLYLYMAPQREPMVFTRRNGLLNGVIHAIIEDDMHNIWVSTSYGICCIRIVADMVKQVFCFSDYDNVPNETFINAKAMKMADGMIVMQGIDHIVTFNPKNFMSLLNQEPYEMRPKLTKLLVNGIDVSAGDKVNGDIVLDKAITRTKEINLNYDQNSISMTFSALNFARPLQTYYRVRIKEISKDWVDYSFYSGNGLVDRKGLLHLPLTGLQPGSYHIELLASVVPGKFVGEPYLWIVNVNEPWWRMTGILFLLGLIMLTMVILNFVVYNRNTRLKMKRNNEEDDVIRRIKVFVDRCENCNSEQLSPTQEEIYGTDKGMQIELDDDFVKLMLKVIPYVRERNGRPFTMHMLSQATDCDLLDIYDMVLENIHKSPRVLILTQRIDKVATLLKTTEDSIEEIADKNGFISPNYLISKFYHQYRMTPTEYRQSQRQR